MENKGIKLETLRGNIWRLDEKIEEFRKEIELIKLQIAQLESIGKENSINGVEADIDLNRILTRRGSKSKKIALLQAWQKK